jgi:hypothetical protein
MKPSSKLRLLIVPVVLFAACSTKRLPPGTPPPEYEERPVSPWPSASAPASPPPVETAPSEPPVAAEPDAGTDAAPPAVEPDAGPGGPRSENLAE